MKKIGVGEIASVMGRYYAMDRDNNYDRVKLAYDALTKGEGLTAGSGPEGIAQSYEKGESDEKKVTWAYFSVSAILACVIWFAASHSPKVLVTEILWKATSLLGAYNEPGAVYPGKLRFCLHVAGRRMPCGYHSDHDRDFPVGVKTVLPPYAAFGRPVALNLLELSNRNHAFIFPSFKP